jgi:hypothetical protein
MEDRPELDRYSSDMLDEEEYGQLSAYQRRAAEKQMALYDKENNKSHRGRDLLRYGIFLLKLTFKF